jgi:hypothetical protein
MPRGRLLLTIATIIRASTLKAPHAGVLADAASAPRTTPLHELLETGPKDLAPECTLAADVCRLTVQFDTLSDALAAYAELSTQFGTVIVFWLW